MSFRPPPPSSAPKPAAAAATTEAPKALPPTKKQKKDRGIWSLVWPFLREQTWWIIGWLIASVIGTVIATQAAGALQSFVDRAIIAREIPISRALGFIVFLTVLASIFGIPARLIVGRVLYHLDFRLKVWLYERLQAIDPRKMDAVASGQLITRANADLALFEAFLLIVPALLGSIPVLLGFMIFLLTRNVPMTLLVTASIPINLYFAKRMAKPLWAMSWMHLNRLAQVTTVTDEAVRGIRTVKSFGREAHERGRLKDAAERAYGVVMERTKFLARWDVGLKVVPQVMNIIVIFAAGRLIVGGSFTIGAMLVFVRYSQGFTGLASGLDGIINGYQYIKTAAGRIYELIFGQHRIVERGGAPLPDVKDGLLFDKVTVRYGANTVIEDLDIEIRPGELVVVQGGPGSGKSTIANLAVAEVEATDGEVLLEDWDVLKLHPARLRREVRVLNEDPFLFGRTVRENLEMGSHGAALGSERPKVSEDDIRSALEAANATEIVEELAGGLDEELGDRGLTLSGGQRQRIGLARALVAPPRVLVLDDALLAVNPAMEADIIQRIRRHAPETSILVLTRRAGLEQIADRAVRLPGALVTEFDEKAEDGDTLRKDAPYNLALQALVNSMPDKTESGEKPPIAEDAATMSDRVPTVMNLITPMKVLFGFVALLALALTAASIIPNILFRDAVDAIEAENLARLDRQIMLMAVSAVAFGVVVYVNRIFRQRVSSSITYQLQRRVFQRLSRLGIDFFDRELPGQMATRVVYDTGRVQEFVEDGPYRIVNMLLLLTATLIVVFSWNAGIGFISIAFIPLLVVISVINFPIADRLNRRVREGMGKVNERLQEDFVGRYAIHTYNTQGWAKNDFAERARNVRNTRRTAVAVGALYGEGFELVLGLAAAAVLNRAGHLVVDGVLTTGTMTAMYSFLGMALAPIPALAGTYQSYLVARASFLKLRDVFTADIRPEDGVNAKPCPELDGKIVMDAVSFSYPGTKRTVLEDVNLSIEAGEVVALVGPTGAGKSSVAKLVQRMYDPDRGTVSVDGNDLRSFTSDTYRHRLGIVPQEVFCFRGTVLQNAVYGRPNATVTDVERAAQEVGVLDALRTIPGGWNGYVAEEGQNLTAAHRQMIGIVRAWLTDPDILIFDEATATLNEELEREVLEAISSLDCTTIFITHRLSVAKSADRVVVVDQGRIVESGPHADLIRAAGTYARLWAFGPEVDEKAMAAAARRRERTPEEIEGERPKKLRKVRRSAADGERKVRRASANGERKVRRASADGERKVRRASANGERKAGRASTNGRRTAKSSADGKRNGSPAKRTRASSEDGAGNGRAARSGAGGEPARKR